MSIKVEEVSKYYGDQAALDKVSFEIKQGEIVGFLGPNGAGKSTMMKILTCYIPKSEGSSEVCGWNVDTHSMEVRKRLGYLPENNPLYLEMYVKEYLSFVASIYKISNRTAKVLELIELVGLEIEQNKKIGTLSKGYRQRVGLAQALIHDPEVLILDEPTSGLDPNQLEEIRKLIQEIGKTKTVMLSTHIMQEVEAICDRVIIIKQGKIVADDTAQKIQQVDVRKKTVFVEFDQETTRSQLSKINNISSVKQLEGNQWLFSSEGDQDPRADIAKFAQDNELLVLTIRLEERSMEEVFKELTKG